MESPIQQNDEINVSIYRYKFLEQFTQDLYKFSKIHQYDHRKDFKEAWNVWIEENNELVDDEVRRLTNLGYNGNVLDKMFKSARYYFRNKTNEKKEPQQRRVYVGVQKEFLDAINDLLKQYGGFTLEGPDWAGDVILRRQLDGEAKRKKGATHFAAALRQIMGKDLKNAPTGEGWL